MAGPVKRVPQGFHTLTPHLVVRGAAEAIDFYKKAFGGRELSRAPGPDGKTVMHAEIQIGDSRIFLNDECPDMGVVSPLALKGSPVTLHLYVEDADTVAARAVRLGAKTTMPVTDMFWGDRYGQIEDPFGHRWSIATHIRDVAPAEMQKAMQSMCSQQKAVQPV